jgi:hypothetical protein
MTFGKAKRIYAGEELGGIRYSDTGAGQNAGRLAYQRRQDIEAT